MSRHFTVGLFSHGDLMRAQSMTDRNKDLVAAVDMLNQEANRLSKRSSTTHLISSIFVAPEYFVSHTVKEDDLQSDYPIDEDTKDITVTELALISITYKNILFVPGTIAFRKSMERGPDRKATGKEGNTKYRSP